MNVNSRGHNLDTNWSQLFPEKKHVDNPVGIIQMISSGFQTINTLDQGKERMTRRRPLLSICLPSPEPVHRL
jgi:hypothetical protein